MPTAQQLQIALDKALVVAHTEYRVAVYQLADREAGGDSSDRAPADVDHIHHARTRVIALDAARDELSRMIDEDASLSKFQD